MSLCFLGLGQMSTTTCWSLGQPPGRETSFVIPLPMCHVPRRLSPQSRNSRSRRSDFQNWFHNQSLTCWEPFWHPGTPRETILALREHLGKPFWQLECTLGGHFGTSGPPWKTMREAGWTQTCEWQDLYRFWNDFWTYLCAFFCFRMLRKTMCFETCFYVIFLANSNLIFRHLRFKNHIFRTEGIAKNVFSWKSCLKNSGMYL